MNLARIMSFELSTPRISISSRTQRRHLISLAEPNGVDKTLAGTCGVGLELLLAPWEVLVPLDKDGNH
jgi:hypothetical protein